jgi:hypothetical protein
MLTLVPLENREVALTILNVGDYFVGPGNGRSDISEWSVPAELSEYRGKQICANCHAGGDDDSSCVSGGEVADVPAKLRGSG